MYLLSMAIHWNSLLSRHQYHPHLLGEPTNICASFLSLDAYRRIYDNTILLPNADIVDKPLQYNLQSNSTDNESDRERARDRVIALHARCQPGRPRKVRIQSGVEGPFGPKCPKAVED